jgi:hypothetical protein
MTRLSNEVYSTGDHSFSGLKSFNSVNVIDQILQGVELADKSKKDDEIFKVPIIIIPGNLPFFS